MRTVTYVITDATQSSPECTASESSARLPVSKPATSLSSASASAATTLTSVIRFFSRCSLTAATAASMRYRDHRHVSPAPIRYPPSSPRNRPLTGPQVHTTVRPRPSLGQPSAVRGGPCSDSTIASPVLRLGACGHIIAFGGGRVAFGVPRSQRRPIRRAPLINRLPEPPSGPAQNPADRLVQRARHSGSYHRGRRRTRREPRRPSMFRSR